MYLRTSVANLYTVRAVFDAYLRAPLQPNQLLLRLQVPLNFEKNPDRKYAKAAQMTARGMVGVEALHLFTPYIRICDDSIEILHGSGSLKGGKDLALMLPVLYPKILQLQAYELINVAAFYLGDFVLRLYTVSAINLDRMDSFNLYPAFISSVSASPKDMTSIILRISSERVTTQALLKYFEEMLVGYLFQQFKGVYFERMCRISEATAQNGLLTYKQRPISTLDDLRLQCNHYIENYKDASKVFLGTKHTRLYNAVNCDWQGTADAFYSGGLFVDFEWEMCYLSELFYPPTSYQAYQMSK